MPFTLQELENISNAAIDFHDAKGKVRSQTLQDKPLYEALRAAETEFPGGKERITVRVKGQYSTTIQGFEHDDTVTYGNPANIKEASYPWKLIHSGIQITMHELAKDGISVVDSTTGATTTKHDQREMTALANLLEDKLEDMEEGTERGFNLMYWRDGSQDAKLVPGIRSFILDDPTDNVIVGGIDQATNTWWRNRASLGLSTASADAQVLVTKLQSEWRQLRRFGGRPNKALAGSDFLEWFEKELRAKGNYTQEGWAKSGKIDASVADVSFKGTAFEYDPTLDDEGRSKFAYVLDTRHIKPRVIAGESMKKHNPARPENKYVFYRAKTWMGGLTCDQRNCHGVYSIA